MIFDHAHERPLSPHYPPGDNPDDIALDHGLDTPQCSPMHANLDDLDVDSDPRHEHDDRSAEVRLQAYFRGITD